MNKSELKAIIKGRKEVYVLFYTNDDNGFNIFSGGRFLAPDAEAERHGNIICCIYGEPLPDDIVITNYTNQLKKKGY